EWIFRHVFGKEEGIRTENGRDRRLALTKVDSVNDEFPIDGMQDCMAQLAVLDVVAALVEFHGDCPATALVAGAIHVEFTRGQQARDLRWWYGVRVCQVDGARCQRRCAGTWILPPTN